MSAGKGIEGNRAAAMAKEGVEGAGEDQDDSELEVTARPAGGAKKGGKGKEREKRATRETQKVKGRENSGSDGADEGEGEEGQGKASEEGQGASAKLEPMDTVCNDAIFGYCPIDLFSPPAPIIFGRYNKRPLVEAKARSFAINVGGTNVRPFARNNMLPLVISKADVEAECYQLGGRHRYRAMEILREKSAEIVTTLKDKLADTRRGMKKMEGQGKRHANAVEKIEELEKRLKAEKEVEENLSVWGVILYEEGELIIVMNG
jgi:hypothetical protein